MLKKIAKYIQEQNEKIYAPLGLLLTDPIERGLRVVSFSTWKSIVHPKVKIRSIKNVHPRVTQHVYDNNSCESQVIFGETALFPYSGRQCPVLLVTIFPQHILLCSEISCTV